MNQSKFYKPGLALLAVALLVSVSFAQKRLNRDRGDLGLTRVSPLENAPPVLAFTTVALGGFRGLIANALWIRANEMQINEKFFEMVQLSDWITKLQPHFVPVWQHLAWNMAYNISVKFPNHADRWMWVRRGIELLRDEALRYNPRETLLYHELAWFFQHKMGQNTDEAHMLYKLTWAYEWDQAFGGGRPDFDKLINPMTEEEKERARVLREKYKMDPARLKKVDERYGPLDWRLPESHAIYWAATGLELAKPEELLRLRRVIYQSMQLAVQRGRMIENKADRKMEFGPNIEMIPNANRSYEEMIEAEPMARDHIAHGHQNFLKKAVSDLYIHNRQTEAAQWFDYLKKKYPESVWGNPTLDEYVLRRITELVETGSVYDYKNMIEGLLSQSYYFLALGEDDQAIGLERFARKLWLAHEEKVSVIPEGRVNLPPYERIKQDVLNRLIDPERGLMSPQLAAQLRTRLELPAEPQTPAPKPGAPAPGSGQG